MGYLQILDEIAQSARAACRSPDEVRLVAVTKGRPLEDVMTLYHLGVRDFGESRLQEALPKIEKAPSDIRWHYIGAVQRKKVGDLLRNFHIIHSVPSLEAAEKISQCIEKGAPSRPLLLQVNVSGEKTKGGFSQAEWEAQMDHLLKLPLLDLRGWMTMAPQTEDQSLISTVFSSLRKFRDRINSRWELSMRELSMGMSADFPIAIREGATFVRIGTSLWH